MRPDGSRDDILVYHAKSSSTFTDPSGDPFEHALTDPLVVSRPQRRSGPDDPLSWLLGLSVREMGIVCAMKLTSLPKHGRCEYNQQGSFCSYSLATRLFSRRRGSIRALFLHLDQATRLFQFSCTPRMCFAADQTTGDLSFARHARRSDQRKVRTACRKRVVAATTHHPASARQTTSLQEDR